MLALEAPSSEIVTGLLRYQQDWRAGDLMAARLLAPERQCVVVRLRGTGVLMGTVVCSGSTRAWL